MQKVGRCVLARCQDESEFVRSSDFLGLVSCYRVKQSPHCSNCRSLHFAHGQRQKLSNSCNAVVVICTLNGQSINGTCGEFEGLHEVFDEDERSELDDGRVELAKEGGAGVFRLVLGHRHVHFQIRLKNTETCSLNFEVLEFTPLGSLATKCQVADFRWVATRNPLFCHTKCEEVSDI